MCKKLNLITSNIRVHLQSGCFTVIQRFAKLVKIGWIHYTSKAHRNSLEVCIKDLDHNETNDNSKTVAEELHEFTRNMLPLKTLTRQCIMWHVMWKDIKHPPLPRALKVYLRVGELSPDHSVHSLSKAQLTA